MFTNTGKEMSWKEFHERRAKGEQVFIGNYPNRVQESFLVYAHKHTKAETETWLEEHEYCLDIMYTNGRPTHYDKWNGECAGVRCLDGILWN